jgi:ubiquinone biosynthesis monooxygenase Coq7
MQRSYTSLDLILHSFGKMLSQNHQKTIKSIRSEENLSLADQKLSANLMRINHAGEVCAQGLYLGQALFIQNKILKQDLLEAALEEGEHLRWCHSRLLELNSHPSYLSPLWYMGSLSIGLIASAFGDAVSLGFLEETEQQVIAHLDSHLEKLPKNDLKTRAIIEKMKEEEAMHALKAKEAGSCPLPWPIPNCMRWTARIMTNTSYYI